MPLPTAAPERQLSHRRSIDLQIYARGNGLWEVDAWIEDVRARAVRMVDGIRPAGEPIHRMLLRIVVDEQFNIVEAGAETYSMPYPGECDAYGDAYGRLVGMNLKKGFRHAVRDRLGGVKGCTHINELSQVLPTAVIQAFAGQVIDSRGDAPGSAQPFQLDRCQALRLDGPAVRIHYPRWYRPPAAPSLRDGIARSDPAAPSLRDGIVRGDPAAPPRDGIAPSDPARGAGDTAGSSPNPPSSESLRSS